MGGWEAPGNNLEVDEAFWWLQQGSLTPEHQADPLLLTDAATGDRRKTWNTTLSRAQRLAEVSFYKNTGGDIDSNETIQGCSDLRQDDSDVGKVMHRKS